MALVLCASCAESAQPVAAPLPASIVAETSPSATTVVGTSAGIVSVRVLDAASAAVPNALVSFTVTKGAGQLGAPAARTGVDGVASTTFRAGATVGVNEITALVARVPAITFTVAGTAGAARTIAFGQRSLKYSLGTDSLNASAAARDTFANSATGAITWVARAPTLVSVTSTGVATAAVKVLKRPGSTYLVASSGAAADSLPVMVLDASSTPCTYQAVAGQPLPVGGSQVVQGGLICVTSAVAGAEYAVVAHLNTAAYSVSQSIEVIADGIVAPVAPFPDPAPGVVSAAPAGTAAARDAGFESRMRTQEGREIGPRLSAARAVFAGGSNLVAASANVVPSVPREGQIVSLNVNAQDFCAKPDMREGRVVAVTSTAIIIADLANPTGGFTDDEYRSFGVELDTLVTPLDTGAFGTATDIDNNGRVAVFFTSAVNDLTPQGSPSGVVLGYYYLRDLLPRQSAFGACPGSNVGEMFYLLVPDPDGTVNGNARDKVFVGTSVVGTIAHEYQHLINASRRMYKTNALRVDEEVWLNEGLSHVAEELLFYRASGLQSRTNIVGSQLALGTTARSAFDNYQRSNFGRYQQYLRATESNSPMASDDQLATRGATWSFLRYLADRVRPADGDFWRKLVNSHWTGVVNVDSVLAGTGVTTMSALGDWATSVVMDDIAPAVATSYQQPSWNFVSAFAGVGGGLSYALAPRVLSNGLSTAVGVVGGGTSYMRFGVAQNKEALVRVSAVGGGPLPAGIRVTVVRIK
ncbi:MAG TPA: Ig-like domain-containing protein [Gemmatimonadaceae bacterium]